MPVSQTLCTAIHTDTKSAQASLLVGGFDPWFDINYISVVVCTDLAGKGPQGQVGVLVVVTPFPTEQHYPDNEWAKPSLYYPISAEYQSK